MQEVPKVRPGIMVRDQLRQAKNTFIVTVSQACRAANEGVLYLEK